jgi:hypothetical protein
LQNLLETLALSKLGAKSGQLKELMGIPAALYKGEILDPHTKHVVLIVIASKIRARQPAFNLRRYELYNFYLVYYNELMNFAAKSQNCLIHSKELWKNCNKFPRSIWSVTAAQLIRLS